MMAQYEFYYDATVSDGGDVVRCRQFDADERERAPLREPDSLRYGCFIITRGCRFIVDEASREPSEHTSRCLRARH